MSLSVVVVGAGIIGVWQALELARRGHRVVLREAMPAAEIGAASRFAGAMIAPFCEAEGPHHSTVRELGLRGLALWQREYPELPARGTLVLAARRDEAEIRRFSRMTCGHIVADRALIASLEPEAGLQATAGLYFAQEAHVSPRRALSHLLACAEQYGATVQYTDPVGAPLWLAAGAGEVVIDCRGLATQGAQHDLRGVRGEMIVVKTRGARLARPIRFLHPRWRLYAVPWEPDIWMIGATETESQDGARVSVRSGLDLLSSAVALAPSLADAEVVELSAGVRPAYPGNLPQIRTRGRVISVNGAYRHGFLLAPVLAEAVANHIEGANADARLFA